MMYLIGAVVFLGMLIGSYALGRSDGRSLEAGEHKKAEEIVELARAEMTSAAVDAISQIEVKNVHTTQRLEKETVEVPVYRDCVHSDDAFRLLNDALTPPERRQDADPTVVPGTDDVE